MKKYHSEDCQYLYKRLLFTLDHGHHPDNVRFYAKTLQETENCDHVVNFEQTRNEITNVNRLWPESHEPSEKTRDRIIRHNVFHFHTDHRAKLRSALSPKNRLAYEYDIFKAELWRIYGNIFS